LATVTAQGQATAKAQEAAMPSARSTEEAQAAATAQAVVDANARAIALAKTQTAAAIGQQPPGLVLDFERELSWRRGDEPHGEFAHASEQAKAGTYSGRIRYEFPAVQSNYVVFLAQPAISLSGKATGLVAWVYGDGSGHFLNAWVKDAAGEVRQYTFGRIEHQGWQQITAWFNEELGWPNSHISGPDDGRLSYPVALYALVLDGVPDGRASSGSVYLDEIYTTQEPIPEPTAGQ